MSAHDSSGHAPQNGPVCVSVVIPTRNRPGQLPACLAALARQTMPPGSFEVVVVDDGGTSPHLKPNTGLPLPQRLEIVRHPRSGPAAARNLGVQRANGTFVAFTDDDTLPAPDWLEVLTMELEKRPEALVGGRTFNGLIHDKFAAASQFILDMVYEHFNGDRNASYFFASNNMACKKTAFLEVGGFDPSFPFAAAEDRDFCDRWRAHHKPMIWAPQALMEHRHPQSFREFLKVHYRYGRGAFLYAAKRKARGSGGISDELSFHGAIPRHLRSRLREETPGRRLMLVGCIFLWQMANAAGFFHEAAARRLPRT